MIGLNIESWSTLLVTDKTYLSTFRYHAYPMAEPAEAAACKLGAKQFGSGPVKALQHTYNSCMGDFCTKNPDI